MNTIFIFIGAPGSGKGTQAERLSKILHLPEISSGNLLRSHIQSGTDLGKQAEVLIQEGRLVSDELVSNIIFARIKEKDCNNGYILDGFPRTLSQAMLFHSFAESQAVSYSVIYLNLPEKDILNRILSRVSCSGCGIPYSKNSNFTNCPKCGSSLIERTDDNATAVKQRISTYFENTLPILNFFQNFGKVREIEASGTIDTVFYNIKRALNIN